MLITLYSKKGSHLYINEILLFSLLCLVLITCCLLTSSDFIFSYFPNFNLFFLTDSLFLRENMLCFPCVSLAAFLAVSFGEASFSPGLPLPHYTLPRYSLLFLSVSLRRVCSLTYFPLFNS